MSRAGSAAGTGAVVAVLLAAGCSPRPLFREGDRASGASPEAPPPGPASWSPPIVSTQPEPPASTARGGWRSVLPDVGRRPREVVVSVNTARRAALRNAELVTRIVNGLPPSTTVHVLTNDRAALAVARDDRPGRVRFIELPADNPITIWPQDPFLVLTPDARGGRPMLLTSREFDRAGDRLMAQSVARSAGLELRASELSFEGGNVVSDAEHVLVGENTIRHNARALGESLVEVVLRFEEELGRRVLVVGPFPQPVAHLDMILTPLGEGRLALADPAAGARIGERALAEDPSSVAAFERLCEELFFGDPRIRELPLRDGGTSEPPRLAGQTRTMIELSRALAPVLDGVAASLEEAGYRVARVPFLFGGPESRAAEPGVTTDRPRAGYPMLTYNNVLLEVDVEGPVVYLPSYGWDALDAAAVRAWRSIGFAPRPIEGLVTSAMYGGALRCAVKVLSR
ncbi:MAG TPA: hypothetical protein VML54_08010 [Candidatus Limnocylindrales bacterium]|nr:hypothetical protein [Candidatus Limnocylindrales bacterium]